MKRNTLLIGLLAVGVGMASCKKEGCTDSNATNYDSKAKKDDGSCNFDTSPSAAEKKSAMENYANIVHANYEDALNDAKKLQAALVSFTKNPSASEMKNAKDVWLAARESYGQSEAFRFANGPIDNSEESPEGLLNAWPLDENYIDYVNDNGTITATGIINDTVKYPTLSTKLLEALNEKGGEANVSTGYHAIEFLLWGQDLSTSGAGARPVSDFEKATSGKMAERRAIYINYCADLIVGHLEDLTNDWKSGGSFRTAFLGKDADEALKEIMTGIGVLSKSELASERMFTALKNQDQEEEHSCFSDNTHRDIITNAMGIQNVFEGKYTRVDGTVVSGKSIKDLVAKSNSKLATETSNMIASALTKTKAIPVPFDNAIMAETAGGDGPIMSAIRDLQSSGDKIAECAKAVGITISTDLPE